jgi:hypothetical protein
MKNAVVSAIAILLTGWFAVTPGSSFAWEFSMDGSFTWEFKLYSQLGSSGFFGIYDVDAAPPQGDAASLNGWLGNEIAFGSITSGSDVSGATMYVSFNPELRINKAIRLRGTYYIGAWDNQPIGGYAGGVGRFWAPEYFNSTIPGIQSSFSPGFWNIFWLSAQTPWGIVLLGKRPFSFGTGLIFDGEDNTSSESTMLVAPYGPFRIGVIWYPWRRGLAYPALADKNAVRRFHMGAFFTYDAASLSFGSLIEYVTYHFGPESAITQADRATVIPEDDAVCDGTIFTKYDNGRFFFNGEVAWFKQATRRQRDLNNTQPTIAGSGSLFRPTYIDHWRAMTEFGSVVGPGRLSLLWAWVEGPDRRHGILNDRNPDLRGVTQLSNYSVFRPYSILLSWDYGSGNNSLTASVGDIGSDNGYMTDANVYAARIDYAVACNLNTYISFFWAERLSHGYGWGYISPNLVGGAPDGVVTFEDKGTYSNPSPAIPDNNLGWEIDIGFAWQLLDGYTISAAFGYWRPGKWFNFACVDRSNPGWKNPNPGNLWGINPGRSIDPIFGMDLTIVGEF